MEEPIKSEWNEQREFSRIYFSYSEKCRAFQFEGHYLLWCNALLSKITHAAAILDKKIDLDTPIKKVQNIRKKVALLENSNADRMILLQGKEEIEQELFTIESKLDKMVNDVMPFLFINEEVGLDF